MKAVVPRKAVPPAGRSSSEPVRRERKEIPTSEAGPASYPPSGRMLQASPTSARVQPPAMRAHPTKARMQPRASPRAGPSLGLSARERQSWERQGLSVAPLRAEPTLTRRRRSGRSAMLGGPEAPPSCACDADGRSSNRGWRRTGPPPPKLCLRIQLASGWRAPFADSGWVSVT
jgi:hypothetical protein